jgi:hypothetical protein
MPLGSKILYILIVSGQVMKKRFIRGFTCAFLVLCLILFLIIISGCKKDSAADSKKDNPAAESRRNLSSEQKEYLAYIDQIEKDPPSALRIETALEKGEISKEEAVYLTMLTAYSLQELPNQYKSGSSFRSRTGYLQDGKIWLIDNWDSLDEDEKSRLMPFYVTPDDPQSIHNPAGREESLVESLSILPSVEATIPVAESAWSVAWAQSPVPGDKKLKIVYYEKGDQAQRAELVLEAYEYAYTLFKDIFDDLPDQTIYAYLVDIQEGYNGLAYTLNKDNASRCIIEVDRRMNGKDIKSTLAHELFHCFQFELPLDYGASDENKWIMEATATWSEELVYPSYNGEQGYLDYFFTNTPTKLVSSNKEWEYGSYIWFLFLTQKTGSNEVVKTALKDAVVEDALTAGTVSIPDFEKLFSEFAIWNWNQDDFKKYSDVPSFPNNYPTEKSYGFQSYAEPYEYELTVPNPFLGAYYLEIYFEYNDIRKVVFKFKDPTRGDDATKRQALIQINDMWRLQDWSDEEEVIFCRSRPEENIQEVVLIFSDAGSGSIETEHTDLVIDTTGQCAQRWHGKTTRSWNYEGTIKGYSQYADAQTKIKDRATYTVEEELIYNEKTDKMEVVSQVESFDAYDLSDATAVVEQALGDREPVKMEMRFTDETTTSGTRAKSFAPGKRPVKWELYDEYNPSDGISFNLAAPLDEYENWADYTKKNTEYIAYTNVPRSTPHEDVSVKTGKTNPSPSSDLTIKEIPKDRLKGTVVKQEKHGTITYDVTITYDYEYS